MIEKKDLLSLIFAITITLSTICFGFSANYESKSQDSLILSLVEFEKADYIQSSINFKFSHLLSESLYENKQLVLKSIDCQLYFYYFSSLNPDKELLDKLYQSCNDYSKFQEIQNSQSEIISETEELIKLSNEVKPFDSLNNSFEDYEKEEHCMDSCFISNIS